MLMQIDDVELYRTLGANLRQQRRLLGLTQTQVAESAGLLRTSVTNIEAGRQKAPMHVLYTICAVLRIEPSEVFPRLSLVGRHGEQATVPVRLDGEVKVVPPRAAAFLQELMDEGSE